MNRYPRQELFKKRVPIFRAVIGKEYTFMLPGKGALNPQFMFIATLLDYEVNGATLFADPPMRLRVRLAPEFQEAWGLDDPVLEWNNIRSSLPIYEVPESRTRRGFARNLVFANQGQLPPEMLGEIMKFVHPAFKGGPTGAIYESAKRNPKVIAYERARQARREADEALYAQKEEKERIHAEQERLTKEQEEMIEGLDPEEREAAVAMRGGRRRKTRRRRGVSRRRR